MQPINPRSTFIPMTPEGLQTPTTAETKVKLEGQVEEFATLLYAQMFTEMREAGKNEDDESESVFGGGDTDMFMSFVDQQVGKNFSHQGGSGLKDALLRQLTERLDTQAKGGGQ